jgi:hypothetical protein
VRLTKRGKRVRALVIALALVGMFQVITHLWWVGDGYCWGTMSHCDRVLIEKVGNK